MSPAGTHADTHIAIVGAGIGGLAAGHALGRCGFRVTLFEQAETLTEIGSGLSIWENGLQALEILGLRGAAEASGMPWSAYEIHRPGKPVKRRNNQTLSLGGQTSPLIMKRGALFGVLKDNLPPNIRIVKSFKVSGVDGHTLIAEDGRTEAADIIIGADGVHSRVRRQLTDKRPRFCKQVCFRGLAAPPGSGTLTAAPLTAAEVYDAKHHRFGYFPLPGGQVYWFDIVDSEIEFQPFENFRAGAENLSPAAAQLIERTPPGSILCHPVAEMPPVTQTHDFIALMGDAAHPMQPSLGQGACLALEDAVVLADCLNSHADDPAKGIQAYTAKRKRRWKLYYAMCQQLGTGALDKGQPGRRLAVARMVHTPQWALSIFGRRIFAFPQRGIRF